MNTRASLPRTRALKRNLRLFGLLILVGLLWQASPSQATPDFNVTKAVWKMLYGVTDAQINDPLWLAKDDDGDGVSNGDELASGTNPFKAGSALKVTSTTDDANNLYLSFTSELGKLYVLQSTGDLKNGPWSVLTPNVQVMGDGSLKTLAGPKLGESMFYRVLVQDIDSTGDQVSDWAKSVLGLSTAATIGSQSSFDHNSLASNLQGQDVVTLAATDPTTTQPVDNVSPAGDLGVITVSRSGYLLPAAITVPLTKSGTAVEGTDYASLPSSVTFAPGVNAVDVRITPLYNANQTTTSTVFLTAGAPGSAGAAGNYTLGTPSSAGVTIYPPSSPMGTGLTANYYQGLSGTYSSPVNFGGNTVTYTYTKTNTTTGSAVITYTGTGFATNGRVNLKFSTGNLAGGAYDQIYVISATSGSTFTVPITGAAVPNTQSGSANVVLNPPAITRLDPTVGFTWGSGTPITLTNVTAGNYSVIWDGYLAPSTTGNYVFQLDALDQAQVMLDATGTGAAPVQILENGWTEAPTGGYKQSASIPLTSGTRYHIVVNYVEGTNNSTGYARCKLQWQINSGSFANIPNANVLTTSGGSTQGFTGTYYANTTFTAPVARTGTDAVSTISTGDWNVGRPGAPMFQDSFCSRWTGQVLPQYTEAYTFIVNADDYAKLSINGVPQTLRRFTTDNPSVAYSYTQINSTTGTVVVTYPSTSATISVGDRVPLKFTTNNLNISPFNTSQLYSVTAVTSANFTVGITGTSLPASGTGNVTIDTVNMNTEWGFFTSVDRYCTLNLQAGVYYDIKLEHGESGGNASCNLSWFSVDQSKQIIPSSRLFPTMTGTTPLAGSGPAAKPTITSPLNATAFIGAGGPFSFALAASNGATFSASGLPSWLTLTNGVLSGTPTQAGIYQFTITATNAAGSGSVVMTVQVQANGGQLTRELWTTGVTGPALANVPWASTPSSSDTVSTLEDNATTYGANTGERLRGYFTAPADGNYYFWISSSNAAELYVSNDAEPVNKVRRAYVTGPGTATRTWNAQTNQQSNWLSLTGGQKYYVEVLHNTGASGASNNLSVGWFLDPTGTTANPITNGAGPSNGSTGGVVAGFVLSPWDNPPTTTIPGSIYITDLQGANGLTGITGTGGAFIRVNGNTAVVHVSYSGLSSGAVSKGIYAMPVGNNPPQLLFDLNAQDRNYPTQKTTDAGYTWNMQSSDLAALNAGTVFINIATTNNPGGELVGTFGLTAGSQAAPSIPSYPTYTDDHATDAGAARFLNQATFGASPADITYVKANGYRAWIENQIATSSTRNVPYILANLSNDPQNPYNSSLMFNSWWKNAITAPDQLRQRVAFALSEILVVSDTGPLNNNGRILADYYDNLLDNAFGNYRSVMKSVTLTPAMGLYLDMLANDVGSNATGLHPNENYAREIMQLFSIGLYRLWPDGTLALDSNGDPVATYDQSVITGLARVFTGWTWGQALNNGRLPTTFSPSSNYLDPMVLVPTHHELGTKILLDNVMLPAATVLLQNDTSKDPNPNPITVVSTNPALGQGNTLSTSITSSYDLNGLRDLEATLDNIHNNSSIGPYICRQLIQRLVTSHPKPAYVYRVVRAFNGEQNVDGVATGVRGDLAEVIRAILLDSEARSTTAAADVQFGKQREPLLRITGPVRAFPAASIANSTYKQTGLQQILVTTPTPHRVTSGDTVFLDTFVDSGSSTTNLPHTGGYTATTPTYTFTNSTVAYTSTGNTVTVSGANYVAGNKVYLKFGTGGLSTGGSFNALYSIASSTGSNFTVTLGSSPTATSGNVQIFVTTVAIPWYLTGPSPFYQMGDTVSLQFTSGNLNALQFGSLGNYTVTGIVTTGGVPSGFTVDLGTSSLGISGGTGNASLANSFAVNTAQATSVSYTISGTTVTVAAGNGLVPNISGRQIYLKFITGSLYNAGFDGLYTIASFPDISHFTVTLASSPPGSTGGNVLFPRFTGGYNITNAGGVSTISVQTNFAHDLKVGDSVWIDFLVTNTPTPAVSGVYTVAGVQGPNIFTVTVSPTVTAGSQSTSGQFVFPLTAPPSNRNGTMKVNFGTWNMGYSQSDIIQTPLDSTTVFNFFYPDYHYPGAMAQAGMTTPEFQLTNDSNTMNLTNLLSAALASTGGNTSGYTSFRSNNGTLVMDLSPYMTQAQVADGNVSTLVDTLGVLLTGAHIPSGSNTAITTYAKTLTLSSPPTNSQMRDRVRAIVHLIVTSAEYAIQK